MTTAIFAIVIVLLCALGLGLGRVFKSKNPLGCKRCGNPEKKECDVCHHDEEETCAPK